jgi:aerobic carbon-monoxide dehydrogenase medium subunit
MKAAAFDYAIPKSVAEATALLGSNGAATAAIAGGQSLLPLLNLRVALPDLVVDLARLEELKEIAATQTNIRIGALTTHAAIEDGKLPEAFGGLMQKVASKISYRAVRNHGTIGGSVALADPAADWPGALRWGSFKVMRKSGAFANSIAFAVSHGRGGPAAVVLAAAADRPCLLPAVAERIKAGENSEDVLRDAIAQDVAKHVAKDDPYLMRLHTSTVLRAVREVQAK